MLGAGSLCGCCDAMGSVGTRERKNDAFPSLSRVCAVATKLNFTFPPPRPRIEARVNKQTTTPGVVPFRCSPFLRSACRQQCYSADNSPALRGVPQSEAASQPAEILPLEATGGHADDFSQKIRVPAIFYYRAMPPPPFDVQSPRDKSVR